MTRHGSTLVVVLCLAAAACGDGADARLDVSAAASLTDAFADLAAAYEDTAPGTPVALNLGGSATLVEQVLRGAPVDVLATADARTMQRAVDAAVVAEPVPFATNQLVVAAPADGPARGAAALADPGLLVGLCAPEVPCGAAARAALGELGITPLPDTEDADVRTLLARLARGELDVGVVYASDVATADGAVRATALPGAVTTLVIAPVADAPDAARDFVRFVGSPAGTAILRSHGFEPVRAGP